MREEDYESNKSWIGSDATSHRVTNDDGFECSSLIALAIAVDDRSEFNTKYREILNRESEEYDILIKRPVLKTHELEDSSTEWQYDSITTDFVAELLEIDCISNIHIIITTLVRQTAPAYEETEDGKAYLGPQKIEDKITSYYNLISVWDYMDEYSDAPWGTTNVLLDDFGGKDNIPWRRLGKGSDELRVIPQGDNTYPILSLADLTMDYIKDNVDEWSEEEIQTELEGVTPDDSAFVNTKSLDSEQEIEEIVPISRHSIERSHHYPHPIICISRGNISKNRLKRYDIFHEASEYAYENSGCVKFFDEGEDRHLLGNEDYIVCIDDKTENYEKYTRLNNDNAPMVVSVADAFDEFS